MVKPLELGFISDVHLGHNRVPTAHILKGLRAQFNAGTDFKKLDLLFISGDLFDQDVHLSDKYSCEITLWVCELLALCARHDVVLRILEGTPSHDRGQSRIFETHNKLMGKKTDVKYVDVLSIEHIDKFNLDVLYVPDEWRIDPDDTWEEVKACLREHNLTSVDYAIMHGFFDFQLPPLVKLTHHLSSRYEGIVKRHISNGHDHTFKRSGKIFVQGSFDRLCHGEEEPKGWIRVTDKTDIDGTSTVTFVPNPHATPFNTYTVLEETPEEEVEVMLQEMSALPPHAHIRIVVSPGCQYLPRLKAHAKGLTQAVTFKRVKEKNALKSDAKVTVNFTPIPMEEKDLPDLLFAKMCSNGLDKHQAKQALALLEELE